MKKNLVLVTAIALVLIFSLTACGALKDIKNMGDAFMTALKTGDHATSYQMLSEDVKAEVGGEAGWAEWAAIRNFDSWKFNSNSIENDTATLEGTAKLDGEDYAVALIFEKFNEAWKITGISFQ